MYYERSRTTSANNEYRPAAARVFCLLVFDIGVYDGEHSAERFSLVIYFGEQAKRTRGTHEPMKIRRSLFFVPFVRYIYVSSLEVNVATTLPRVYTYTMSVALY